MGLFAAKKIDNKLIPEGLTACAKGADIFKQCAPDFIFEIKNLVSVPNEIFEKFYLGTLYSIAEFCQAMPFIENDESYSLLTNQLFYCVNALKLRRGMLLPKNAGAETIAEQESRWTFAIFSASVMYRLHHIQSNRTVYLYNRQGDLISCWHPLIGNLYYADTCYSILWEASDSFESITLASALAKQFISPNITQWLIQNREVKAYWWDAITNPEANNIVTEIILNGIDTNSSKPSKNNSSKNNGPAASENHADSVTTETVSIHENCTKKAKYDCLHLMLTWLFDHQGDLPNQEPAYFKMEQGLFVHERTIDKFLIENFSESMTTDELIDHLKKYLMEKNEKYLFRFRPKAYVDRRIFQGIIVQHDYLSAGWKLYPITKDYLFEIPL